MGGISLPERVWGLDVRSWIARYQTEKLHPSVFPDSVKVGLVDVPFIPTYDMFLYESTGEVRLDAHGNEYTVMRVTPGFSEDDGFKQFDGRPLEPLPLWLMWHGRHAEGEVRPYEVAESAEYMVWEQAWEEMQREGRRLKAQRNGQ